MRVILCIAVLLILVCNAFDLERQELGFLLERLKNHPECPYVEERSLITCPYYEKRLISHGFCVSLTEGNKHYYQLPDAWTRRIVITNYTTEWILFDPMGIPIMKTTSSNCIEELCYSEYFETDTSRQWLLNQISQTIITE